MNGTNEQTPRVATHDAQAVPVCPACGAQARRERAHFCSTCGRGLREHAYAPADSLLASYHQQHSRPAMLFEQKTANVRVARRPQQTQWLAIEGNTSAAIALILVLSALVPVVGVLFCPIAILAGGFGLFEAWLDPRVGGARLAACCIAGALMIGGAQFLLVSLI